MKICFVLIITVAYSVGLILGKLPEKVFNDVDPFTINLKKQKSVTIDLQKLLPIRNRENVISAGDIYAGILNREKACVEIISTNSIPYIRKDGFYNRDAAFQSEITDEQFKTLINNNELVIVSHTGLAKDRAGTNEYEICGGKAFSFGLGEKVKVLIREDLYKKQAIIPPDNRCDIPSSFSEAPGDTPYYREIQTSPFLKRFGLSATSRTSDVEEGVKFIPKHPKRPLFGFGSDQSLIDLFLDEPNCTLEFLQTQLQYAVELEWATIPVYLTAAYSLKPNQNEDVLNIITNISIQEMLHFAQSANILKATGKTPIIDATTQPKFPTAGLPGGVLESLYIPLTKATKKQVHDTFMMIEIPNNSSAVQPPLINDLYTIGAFYRDVSKCVEKLGDSIYINITGQVQHPQFEQNGFGVLYVVNNVSVALLAIEEIIAQGEGEGPLNPDQVGSKDTAHFYSFEEIYCGRQIAKIPNSPYYAYNGPIVPFNESQVYEMIDNPNSVTMEGASDQCKMAAKAFGSAYNSVLQKLQYAYEVDPSTIGDAISQMSTLKVRGQDTFTVQYNTSLPYTCGPVWDATYVL